MKKPPIYSAFLLQHMNPDNSAFDKEALNRDYQQFVILHDQCIEKLREAPKTLASMGIVRRASWTKNPESFAALKPVYCQSEAVVNGVIGRLGSRRARENSQRRLKPEKLSTCSQRYVQHIASLFVHFCRRNPRSGRWGKERRLVPNGRR